METYFFKLNAFSLTMYDKIIKFDSDMLICKNLDILFELESCSAVSDVESIANPHVRSERFNSGLMVISPDMDVYKKLLNDMDLAILERAKNGRKSGDQDVFNYTLERRKTKTYIRSL